MKNSRIKINSRKVDKSLKHIWRLYIYYSKNERNLSLPTIKKYEYSFGFILNYFYDNNISLNIDSFSSSNLADFFNYLIAKTNSYHSLECVYANLKVFVEYCFSMGYLNKNPFTMLVYPKKAFSNPPLLDQRHLNKMLKIIEKIDYFDKATYFRAKVALYLLIFGGLRSAEMIKLKVKDINFKEKIIKVSDNKVKKERIIPLGRKTIRVIKDYILEKGHGIDDNLLLACRGFKALKYGGFSLIISELKRAAGIKKRISPYAFRRRLASNIISEGGEIDYLKVILGHSRLNMTSRYVYISVPKLRKAINMNPLIPKCRKLFERLN